MSEHNCRVKRTYKRQVFKCEGCSNSCFLTAFSVSRDVPAWTCPYKDPSATAQVAAVKWERVK